jgi:hypothetical protein
MRDHCPILLSQLWRLVLVLIRLGLGLQGIHKFYALIDLPCFLLFQPDQCKINIVFNNILDIVNASCRVQLLLDLGP